MKKIVFVINYFYPDLASTGQLMTDLCTHLDKDFKITVIAAQPGYAGNTLNKLENSIEYIGNIKVVRLALPNVNKNSKISRLTYINSYFFRALKALVKEKKIHLIYTISQPPILGGFLGTLGKMLKRCKHVYNIQDFNPEQAVAANYTKSKLIISLAKKIDMLNCYFSDHIVIVGNDMAQTLKERFKGKKVPRYSVINNWTNEDVIVPLMKNEQEVERFINNYHLRGKFVLMYSGNLGLFYDLENLIKLANELKDKKDLVFLFVGEGARKKDMQNYVDKMGLKNVLFLPYQPIENLKYSLNVADAHLVVNQKGIKGVSVPSKIYGVLAAGKPIIGVLEEGSEAERLIIESESGFVSEPQDYKAIKESIEKMYNMNEQQRIEMGLKGRRYLEKHLRRDISIEKYKQLLINLTE
ncbi:glycosyltransferase family 4 protein [Shouchella clausii]|uniref:glycosyltransferase family 4 protein n=1 Tax=Shouchella clausii TaxID=79880 RepID=UPI001C23CA85|nr:glycosyltransferase family 4 protein [Shouchella clausii]MBU8595958.1 glycosyltransferase family 4 protein [Shouchella clausii]MED4157533.1 glycosyltransferase family 4 protein [Shouchella clausii]MED4175632.1 glycosyltransferase family 4 protein [Shouchella clausii]